MNRKKPLNIWARYKSGSPEIIDRASTLREADYMLGEYILAFGAQPGGHAQHDWKLWIGRKDEEPKTVERR